MTDDKTRCQHCGEGECDGRICQQVASIERGLRAVLQEITIWDVVHGSDDLPRLVEIFQKALAQESNCCRATDNESGLGLTGDNDNGLK